MTNRTMKLRLTLSTLLLLATAGASYGGRAMYVSGWDVIYNDDARLAELAAYCQNKEITELWLFNLDCVLNTSPPDANWDNLKLAMADLATHGAVNSFGAVFSSDDQADRIVGYQESLTSADVGFSTMIIECEWWRGDLDCLSESVAIGRLQHARMEQSALSAAFKMSLASSLGYAAGTRDLTAFLAELDEVYLAAFATEPVFAFVTLKDTNLLTAVDSALAGTPKKVRVLFSVEGLDANKADADTTCRTSPPITDLPGSNDFMGEWLCGNPWGEAESDFSLAFAADSGSTMWPNLPTFEYSYFTYSVARNTSGDCTCDGFPVERIMRYYSPAYVSSDSCDPPNAAIVLVLDKSGSMDDPAGTTGIKRVDVLKFSAPALIALLDDDDGIGMVRFDTDADTSVLGVIPANTPGLPGGGREQANAYLAAVNPGGRTSVGDGIRAGADIVTGFSGYMKNAIVVLTDGMENEPEWISDVKASINTDLAYVSVKDNIFAIGLGSGSAVDTVALNAITGQNLLVTGPLDFHEEFLLTKFYLKILADIKEDMAIVVDPESYVRPGVSHEIAVPLAETDSRADVILLTPAPWAIEFTIESPAGQLIDPGGTSGVSFVTGERIAFYRVSLPVVLGEERAHRGTWVAHLKVSEEAFDEYLGSLADAPERLAVAQEQGVHYSLNVHTQSSLRMKGTLLQDRYLPGATLTLRITLTEYSAPVEGRATVTATVVGPDQTATDLTLTEIEPGIFEAALKVSEVGLYRYRVVAEGTTFGETPFLREQLFTGVVTDVEDDGDLDDVPFLNLLQLCGAGGLGAIPLMLFGLSIMKMRQGRGRRG